MPDVRLLVVPLLLQFMKLKFIERVIPCHKFDIMCCNNEALDADDNAIKTSNLSVKSLPANCELSDIFVFKQTKTISTSQTNVW